MKKNKLKSSLLLLLVASITGCAEYERTEVEERIYVNQTSLSLFVGDEVKLTVSPTEKSYEWFSENPEIATVTANGLVTAVGEGSTTIVVSDGNMRQLVSLTAITKIPLENVLLSEDYIEAFPGDKRNILVTLIPENVNVLSTSSWHSENTAVATVSSSGEIVVTGEGMTNIIYKIGDFEKKIVVDAAYTRPFNGPHILTASQPLIIKAADFDFGGEGYAFHETDEVDQSGLNGAYRISKGDNKSNSVDIEGEDGFNVGWANDGEWLLYTIEVEDGGDYAFETCVAIRGNGGRFQIHVDNVNVTGSVVVPNTGNWASYVWVSEPKEALTLNLTKGRHKIKYFFEGEHNISEIKFTKK